MTGTNTPDNQDKKMKTFSDRHTKNALVFLFFIAMATVFWVIQKLEEPMTVPVNVPVKLVNVPRDVIITTELPPQMQIGVRDKGNEILALFWRPQLDTLHIDFKEYDTHEITGSVLLIPSILNQLLKEQIPPQSSITDMKPDTLVFAFNRGIHRQLPVRLRGTLTANDQYNLDSYAFYPDSVEVYAPAKILDTMKAAYTELTILDELTETTEFRIPLARSRSVRFFPDTVSLRTNVDILTRKSVEVYVQGIGFPEGKELRTYPATVTVTYLVSATQAKVVDTNHFQVIVNYSDIKDESSTTCQPVLAVTPANISSAFITPMQVEYLVEDITTAVREAVADEQEEAEEEEETAERTQKTGASRQKDEGTEE